MTGSKWKPRRELGGIYCSPACGAGCKWSAYQRAHKAADRLAKRMGTSWRPDVWENLGWHYAVSNGDFRITVNQNEFTVWFNGAKPFIVRGPSPENALAEIIICIRDHIALLERQLAALVKSKRAA